MSADASTPLAVQEQECPVCGTVAASFLPAGPRNTPNRRCPTCGSLERHGLLWLYFTSRTNLFTERVRMLHIAPERCFSERLQACENIDYVSADIQSALAMVQMDITEIQFPAESFDVIYASHVLEHVEDDRRAMRELFRILRPGGWAVLQVPIWGERTLEDPTVVDPEERTRLFGQSDHVRVYGHDGVFDGRLREAGFEVRVDAFARELGPAVAKRYRFPMMHDIYFCSRARR